MAAAMAMVVARWLGWWEWRVWCGDDDWLAASGAVTADGGDGEWREARTDTMRQLQGRGRRATRDESRKGQAGQEDR